MTVGYRAFCATCLWDDGIFFNQGDAAAAFLSHVSDGGEHDAGVDEWDYQDQEGHQG